MSNLVKFFTALNVIWLGLILRIAVALWNSFFGPSFGAANDAAGFHEGAVAYSKGLNFSFYHADVYMYVMGSTFYRWINDSLFFGCLLSCMTWLASSFVLLKMMRLLSLSAFSQFQAMFIFGLLPSAILITSVTLREAYQLLALNLSVYSALQIYMNKSNIYWFLLLVSVGLMGLLHWALLMAGLVIAGIVGALSFYKGDEEGSLQRFIFWMMLIAALTYAGSMLILNAVLSDFNGLAAAIQSRQDSWQQIARAHYSIGIRVVSDLDLLFFVPAALFHYLFQPMPWHISTVADFGLLLENLLRAWLLCRALLNLHQLLPKQKIPVLIVFLCYLATEILWAIGTINWGTAARHHVPSLGLLVLAAFAVASRKH
jgi:hypothetical protein